MPAVADEQMIFAIGVLMGVALAAIVVWYVAKRRGFAQGVRASMAALSLRASTYEEGSRERSALEDAIDHVDKKVT